METNQIQKQIEKQQSEPKPPEWHGRFLYDLPNGTQTYFTKKEMEVANRLLKEAKDKKLSKVVSPKSLDSFFSNAYVLSLEGDLKWFAKQFYKTYIMDFEAYRAKEKKKETTKGSRR